MCGRFSLSLNDIYKLAERFQAIPPSVSLQPHYNIAPDQKIWTVLNWQGKRQLIQMNWGLKPYWSRGKPKGPKLINVRSESLIQKPIFKPYVEHQRCLIPADGFFEWRHEGSHKIPYRSILKEGALFAFAGLWDCTPEANETPSFSCSILTTQANILLGQVHDRMPVILPAQGEDLWLDSHPHSKEELLPLLQPYPSELMELFEVSSEVNSWMHDTPKCIEPKL